MRKTLWLILLPAVLLIAGYWYLRHTLQASIHDTEKTAGGKPLTDTLGGKKVSLADLRPLFIKRVQQLVKQSSDGLYNLTIANVELDVLAATISLQGVALLPDSSVLRLLRQQNKLPKDVLSISFDSLRIEGITLDDALTTKTMNYSLIKLIRPVITIHHLKEPVSKDVAEKEDFAQRFLKEMESLAIKNVVVEEGTLNLYNDAKKDPPVVLKQVAIALHQVQLDSATRRERNRFLFAESGTFSFEDYRRPTPDGLYVMKIAKVQITAPQNNVTLTNFSFTSPYNRAQFSKRQKRSKEWYNVWLPAVTLQQVNWWALLNEEELAADTLQTTGGTVAVFLDRTLPPRNRMGNFPSQLLMKLPMKVQIAKAALHDLHFSYAEYNPLSNGTGTIYLDKVQLQIANLSNEQRVHPQPLSVWGTARLMHKVPVEAQFRFDMGAYKSGRFQAHIKTSGFAAALLNSFTVPMGLIKLERGTLQSAEASLHGDAHKAAGTVSIRYTDLKIAMLEKDKGRKEPDKKDVTSLLANLVLLKKDNPQKGKPPRTETAAFTRDPNGGFFMLLWKTILVGALKTIGAPTKIASKTGTGSVKK